MDARTVIEAESPKRSFKAAQAQWQADYQPTSIEQSTLDAVKGKQDLLWQRYEMIKREREQGLTWKAIGQRHNVSAAFVRNIFMKGQRLGQAQPPEQQLSGRAYNWLKYTFGYDPATQAREAAMALGEKTPRELTRYRHFGFRLYIELRHWALKNYGVKLPHPEEMANLGSSEFKKFAPYLPKAPNYEI